MPGPERTPGGHESIARIRSIDTDTKKSGRELIKPEEERERNLQEAFVEVLAYSGIPFETAHEIADVAWDIHRNQIERRGNPQELSAPPESPEDRAMRQRWEAMTQEERDAESKARWDALEANPEFKKSMREGIRDVENGRYFFRDVFQSGDRIPKLKVVKKSEAAKKREADKNRKNQERLLAALDSLEAEGITEASGYDFLRRDQDLRYSNSRFKEWRGMGYGTVYRGLDQLINQGILTSRWENEDGPRPRRRLYSRVKLQE